MRCSTLQLSCACSLAAPVARLRVFVLLSAAHRRCCSRWPRSTCTAQQTAPAPAARLRPTPPTPATTQAAQTPASRLLPLPRKASQHQRPRPRPQCRPGTGDGSITEEELRKQLVGKELYLRGGYLDNTLSFNEHGELIGHSPQGSYTLSGIQIEGCACSSTRSS